jgi:hypothetical protein
MKRSKTSRNGEGPGTENRQERLMVRNALQRIIENGHGTVTFTLQKRKNYRIYRGF